MAALLEVLPLQIPALRPSSPEAGAARGALGGPLPGAGGTASHSSKATIPYVKLCGLRLPESFAPYVDDPKEAQVRDPCSARAGFSQALNSFLERREVGKGA